MAYSRTQVRQAFLAAQDAGKDLSTLRIGDRETVLQLERWGFLPLDQSMYDKKIADWYVANGLATRRDDTPDAAPRDTPDAPLLPTHAAFAAAEAALATAQACLALARMSGGGGGLDAPLAS